jgi:hypothetical protein
MKSYSKIVHNVILIHPYPKGKYQIIPAKISIIIIKKSYYINKFNKGWYAVSWYYQVSNNLYKKSRNLWLIVGTRTIKRNKK